MPSPKVSQNTMVANSPTFTIGVYLHPRAKSFDSQILLNGASMNNRRFWAHSCRMDGLKRRHITSAIPTSSSFRSSVPEKQSLPLKYTKNLKQEQIPPGASHSRWLSLPLSSSKVHRIPVSSKRGSGRPTLPKRQRSKDNL